MYYVVLKTESESETAAWCTEVSHSNHQASSSAVNGISRHIYDMMEDGMGIISIYRLHQYLKTYVSNVQLNRRIHA